MQVLRGISITILILVGILAASMALEGDEGAATIRVGSKNFTEGYVLAELFAQALEVEGFRVERRFGLGGTLVCYRALTGGEIDVYPEYTGTIAQAILELEVIPPDDELRRRLRADHGLDLLASLGFNNTYAIALERSRARALGLERIGDLGAHPDLRLAFSHEFNERFDGWPGLKDAYALPHTPSGIEHGLAYQAIREGKVDVTDVYSTDGDIRKYDLVLLEDDRNYFPRYLAAALAREELPARAKAALNRLEGTIDEGTMQGLNAEVLLEGRTFAQVASGFLAGAGLGATDRERTSRGTLLVRRTIRHLELTFAALVAAMLLAIPLGVVVYRSPRIARPIVYATGALQTIPSIALLAFMIPLFGIGVVPAMVALFLYALLPILRNTATALFAIDPVVKKVALGMGLTRGQLLRHVEFPLAAPTILAGIKTAAVINIGTATLAAFIGAGGLGEPIVTGLALNNTSLILEGAVPAALLAVITELVFEGIERWAVPRHLTRAHSG